jgi:hypothetical protein
VRREVIPYLEQVPRQLASLKVRPDHGDAPAVVGELLDGSVTALASLREISRGVFPTQLARSGLARAVAGQLGRSTHEGSLTVDESAAGQRFGRHVEAAAYYCFVEVLPALCQPVEVHLAAPDGVLQLRISGAGKLGAVDLQGLHDRLDAVDGTATWDESSERMSLVVRIPSALATASR